MTEPELTGAYLMLRGKTEEAIKVELARIKALEAALRTIREAIPKYLKGEMSEHDFALVVLENVDSAMVNKALEDRK
jgi:hypothetical protein